MSHYNARISLSEESYSQLARKILKESLRVEKGEAVTIETWNSGLPFASNVVLEAKKMGARPLLMLEDEKTFIKAAKTVKKENLGVMGDHEHALLSETDAYVFLPGPPLAFFSKLVDREARSASTAYNDLWYDAATKAKLRGVRLSFGYVGREMAQLLGKDKNTIVKHLVDASLCDYSEVKKRADRVSEKLVDGADVSVFSGGQKLEFQSKGEVTVEDGVVDEEDLKKEENIAFIPPGGIFKGVDPDSVNGIIKFGAPLTRYGTIRDVQMKFRNGKLTEWSSPTGKENVDRLLNAIAEEKRSITRASVGLNPVLKYGYSQDRFVSGAIGITIGSFGISGVVASGMLSIGGKIVVEKGRLT